MNESAGALEHHYTRHEASRASRPEDEVLPWRKARRWGSLVCPIGPACYTKAAWDLDFSAYCYSVQVQRA